jgi:hypothetical protein
MVLAVIGVLLVVSFFTSRSKLSVHRAHGRAGGYVGTTPISGDGVSDCGAGDAGCDGGGGGGD